MKMDEDQLVNHIKVEKEFERKKIEDLKTNDQNNLKQALANKEAVDTNYLNQKVQEQKYLGQQMVDSALSEFKKQETLAQARKEKAEHEGLLNEAK